MQYGKWIAVFAIVARISWVQTPTQSYSFLLDENAHTWCGYASEKKFQERAAQVQPEESARVVYKAGRLSEITYETQSESGDWIVIDTYHLSLQRITLRRVVTFAQGGIQVVQEGVVTKGRSTHLSLVSAKAPDGSTVKVTNIDLPTVAIQEDPSGFPFIKLVESIKKQSLSMSCLRVGHS